MTERTTGWLFVAVQAALLGGLIVMPSADHVPTPGWLRTSMTILFWGGVAVAVVAGVLLGRFLTATPVPTAGAELRTSGPYRFVRHPIYTGVVMIVIALAVRSGNALGLALGCVTIGFFHVKATWEEQRLAERFGDYPAYAARTPRFLPRLRPGR